MNRPPRILCSASMLSRGLSSRARKKNHYDSLELDSQATQGEIKSAYFKMTMQYHPDKNDSEAAKMKFQDISEAYEILGNYDKRRQYDRGMQIRREEVKKEDLNPEDLWKQAERVSAIYRRNTTTSSGRMYDFDMWTKEHYERAFKSQWNSQQNALKWERERQRVMAEQVDPTLEKISITMLLMFFGIAVGVVISTQTLDTPVPGHNSQMDRASRDMGT